MARNSSGLFEDLLAAAALLPAPISLLFAVASYFGFHYLVTTVPSSYADHPSDLLGRQIVVTVSLFAQYLLPAVFTLGAGISFYRRCREARLRASAVKPPPAPMAIDNFTGGDFENLTAEVFQRKGYRVARRGDNGVDFEAWSGGDKYLVHSRQWRSENVGAAVVRELFQAIAAEKAAGGFIVSSGRFTDEAWRYAEGRSIELLSSEYVLRLALETGGSPA